MNNEYGDLRRVVRTSKCRFETNELSNQDSFSDNTLSSSEQLRESCGDLWETDNDKQFFRYTILRLSDTAKECGIELNPITILECRYPRLEAENGQEILKALCSGVGLPPDQFITQTVFETNIDLSKSSASFRPSAVGVTSQETPTSTADVSAPPSTRVSFNDSSKSANQSYTCVDKKTYKIIEESKFPMFSKCSPDEDTVDTEVVQLGKNWSMKNVTFRRSVEKHLREMKKAKRSKTTRLKSKASLDYDSSDYVVSDASQSSFDDASDTAVSSL